MSDGRTWGDVPSGFFANIHSHWPVQVRTRKFSYLLIIPKCEPGLALYRYRKNNKGQKHRTRCHQKAEIFPIDQIPTPIPQSRYNNGGFG